MNVSLNTIVAVGALSFTMGIFVSLLCWDRAGLEGKVDIRCPAGTARANMMLVGWAPHGADEKRQVACEDRATAMQLAASSI